MSADIVRQLDLVFRGPAWHGSSLLASVRVVRDVEAGWRPAPGRHSIRELTLHAAYAKHRVIRRLDPAERARFPRPLAVAWWPAIVPEVSWADDRELLVEMHARLIAAIERGTPRRLATRRPGRTDTVRDELLGVAAHDAYHTGQIRLVRALHAER